MSIKEKADEYVKSTLVGSPYIKEQAYLQGARDVLTEIELTISVSKEGWLESNLKKLIKELKYGSQQK